MKGEWAQVSLVLPHGSGDISGQLIEKYGRSFSSSLLALTVTKPPFVDQ